MYPIASAGSAAQARSNQASRSCLPPEIYRQKYTAGWDHLPLPSRRCSHASAEYSIGPATVLSFPFPKLLPTRRITTSALLHRIPCIETGCPWRVFVSINDAPLAKLPSTFPPQSSVPPAQYAPMCTLGTGESRAVPAASASRATRGGQQPHPSRPLRPFLFFFFKLSRRSITLI